MSGISIYLDHIIVTSWMHPLGKRIEQGDIDEVFFRHYAILNSQRIVIKYHNDKKRQKEMVVLCDESDYIEDMTAYLRSETKVRRY